MHRRTEACAGCVESWAGGAVTPDAAHRCARQAAANLSLPSTGADAKCTCRCQTCRVASSSPPGLAAGFDGVVKFRQGE